MEVIFRIPSKVVQYGYAEIKVDRDEDTSGQDLGLEYINLVAKFQSAELGELESEKVATNAKPAKAKPVDDLESKLEEELGATKVGVANPEPWEKETSPVSDKPWERPAKVSVVEPGILADFDF